MSQNRSFLPPASPGLFFVLYALVRGAILVSTCFRDPSGQYSHFLHPHKFFLSRFLPWDQPSLSHPPPCFLHLVVFPVPNALPYSSRIPRFLALGSLRFPFLVFPRAQLPSFPLCPLVLRGLSLLPPLVRRLTSHFGPLFTESLPH